MQRFSQGSSRCSPIAHQAPLFPRPSCPAHLFDETLRGTIKRGPHRPEERGARLVVKRNDDGRRWQLVDVKQQVLAVFMPRVFDLAMEGDAIALELVEVVGVPLAVVLLLLLLLGQHLTRVGRHSVRRGRTEIARRGETNHAAARPMAHLARERLLATDGGCCHGVDPLCLCQHSLCL